MRVLFIINCFSLAGAEKLVMDLSQSIVDDCGYVGIAALYRMGGDMERQLIAQLRSRNIKTYILDKRAGKDEIPTVLNAARIIRAAKPDVIHGHCSVPMLVAKLAGCLTGTPVVATVHNTRGYSKLREQLTGWMCRRYVSIGAAAEAYMTDVLNIPGTKIVRINNAVDTEHFAPAPRIEGFWKAHGLREDLPVVLNVGRVVEQKNQMCLLRGLRGCRDAGNPFQCVILGAYEESSPVYLRMKAYLEENGLTELVRFFGQRDQIAPFLTNADVFVMTSIYEGLSVSFLEALACGTPIVVTRMPFVEELEKNGIRATVIGQDDSDALRDVLLAGTVSPPDETALRQIRSLYSWDTFIRQHLSLYQEVVNTRQEVLAWADPTRKSGR